MISSKVIILLTVGICILLQGYLIHSFKIHETIEGMETEAHGIDAVKNLASSKRLQFPMVLSVRNPDNQAKTAEEACAPCDGFTEEQCSVVCAYYELPYSKCQGCMCMCELHDWTS